MKFRDLMQHGSMNREQLLASLAGGRGWSAGRQLPEASQPQTQRPQTTLSRWTQRTAKSNPDKTPITARTAPQPPPAATEAAKPARAAAAAAPAPKQRKLTDAGIQRSEEEQLYNKFYPARAEPAAHLSAQDQDLYEKFYPSAK